MPNDPPSALRLTPGAEAVWDGRFAFVAADPGWSVVAGRGRLSQLSDADRAAHKAMPIHIALCPAGSVETLLISVDVGL